METRALLAILALTLTGCGEAPEAPVSRQIVDEGRRAHLRSFWETFRAAQEHERAGRALDAIAAYRKALALDPSHEQAHVNLAPLLRRLGRVAEAESVLASLVARHPACARSHAVAGDLAIGLDPGRPVDAASALEHYRRARDTNREESGPFVRLARAHLTAGRWDEAGRELEVVLARLDAGSQEAANLFAIAALARGRPAEARSVLEKVARFREQAGRAPKVSGDGDTLRPLSAHELSGHRFATLRRLLEPGPTGREAPALPPAGGRAILVPRRGARPEVVVVPLPGHGVAALAATGTGVENRAAALGLAATTAWAAALVDLDGDGLDDLYVAGGGWWADGDDSAFRGRADGTFAPLPLADLGLAGARSAALAAVDLDGDGRRDLVLADARSDRPGVRVRTASGAVASSGLHGPVLDVTASTPVLAAHFYDGVHALEMRGGQLQARAGTGLPGPRAGLVALGALDAVSVAAYLTEAPGSAGPGLVGFRPEGAAWRPAPVDLDLRHGVRGLISLPDGALAVLEGGVALDGAAGAALLERAGAGYALRRFGSARTPRAWCVAPWPGAPGHVLVGGAGPVAADRWPCTVLELPARALTSAR